MALLWQTLKSFLLHLRLNQRKNPSNQCFSWPEQIVLGISVKHTSSCPLFTLTPEEENKQQMQPQQPPQCKLRDPQPRYVHLHSELSWPFWSIVKINTFLKLDASFDAVKWNYNVQDSGVPQETRFLFQQTKNQLVESGPFLYRIAPNTECALQFQHESAFRIMWPLFLFPEVKVNCTLYYLLTQMNNNWSDFDNYIISLRAPISD